MAAMDVLEREKTELDEGANAPDLAPDERRPRSLRDRVTGTLVGKLVAAIVLLLLPWGAISLYNLSQAGELADATQLLYDDNVVALVDVLELTREVGYYNVEVLNFLLADDDADRATSMATMEEVREEFAETSGHYTEAIGCGELCHAALAVVTEAFDEAVVEIDTHVLPLAEADPAAALAAFRTDGASDSLDEARAALDDLGDIEQEDAANAAAAAGDTASATASRTTILLLVLVAGSIAGGVWFARRLAGPVVTAAGALVQAAEGDLTRRIDVTSHDEVGRMSTSLNAMLQDLGTTIADIADNSTTLAAASEELSTISSSMTDDAGKADRQVAQVAQAAADASANVSTAAAAAQQLTASIQEISRNVAQSVEIARSASAEAERATTTMQALEAASNEVGDVIGMISAIAQQTDLLALNATIEAARAGEMGKGFAVVATEVKDLAKESSDAAKDVTSRIEAMQSNAQEAIAAINSVATTIESINETSETIAAAVEEQNAATNEIARSLDVAATSTSGIDSAVAEVSAAAASTSRNAEESQRASAELSRMAARLSKLVARFQY